MRNKVIFLVHSDEFDSVEGEIAYIKQMFREKQSHYKDQTQVVFDVRFFPDLFGDRFEEDVTFRYQPEDSVSVLFLFNASNRHFPQFIKRLNTFFIDNDSEAERRYPFYRSFALLDCSEIEPRPVSRKIRESSSSYLVQSKAYSNLIKLDKRGHYCEFKLLKPLVFLEDAPLLGEIYEFSESIHSYPQIKSKDALQGLLSSYEWAWENKVKSTISLSATLFTIYLDLPFPLKVGLTLVILALLHYTHQSERWLDRIANDTKMDMVDWYKSFSNKVIEQEQAFFDQIMTNLTALEQIEEEAGRMVRASTHFFETSKSSVDQLTGSINGVLEKVREDFMEDARARINELSISLNNTLEAAREEILHFGRVNEETAERLCQETALLRESTGQFMRNLAQAVREGHLRPHVDVHDNSLSYRSYSASLLGGCTVM